MIRNSFIFLEKISVRKEQRLWQQGITDWDSFLKASIVNGISRQKKWHYDRKLREAQQALLENDSAYFKKKLPASGQWRLYDYFHDEAGFLDIEIDSYGKITVVGISNYYKTNFLVRGVNLDTPLLQKELQKYKILLTFNGASFDLPILKKLFQINLTIPHIDLKPLCIQLGLKGGLKEVEKQLGLNRPAHLYGNPVELWKAFQASGDKEYLDLLLEYNREDVENLKGVMEYVYGKLKSGMLLHFKKS